MTTTTDQAGRVLRLAPSLAVLQDLARHTGAMILGASFALNATGQPGSGALLSGACLLYALDLAMIHPVRAAALRSRPDPQEDQ